MRASSLLTMSYSCSNLVNLLNTDHGCKEYGRDRQKSEATLQE